jgi:hypothetical protein
MKWDREDDTFWQAHIEPIGWEQPKRNVLCCSFISGYIVISETLYMGIHIIKLKVVDNNEYDSSIRSEKNKKSIVYLIYSN